MIKQLFQNDDFVQKASKNYNHLIDLQHITKAFTMPAGNFLALNGINLRVGSGEFVAVIGKSGSGKGVSNRPFNTTRLPFKLIPTILRPIITWASS